MNQAIDSDFLAEVERRQLDALSRSPLNIPFDWKSIDVIETIGVESIREIIKARGFEGSDEDLEKFANWHKQETDNIVCSKYDHPHEVQMMNAMFGRILKESRLVKDRIKQRIYFGSLQSGSVNAQILRPQGKDQYAILFHSGTWRFPADLVEIFVSCMPHCTEENKSSFSVDAKKMKDRMIENDYWFKNLRTLFIQYMKTGHPYHSRSLKVSVEMKRFAGEITSIIDTFIMAHELGHLVFGHLKRPPRKQTQSDIETVDDLEVKEMPLAWQEELEADSVGLIITRETIAGKLPVEQLQLGISLYFCSQVILQKLAYILERGELVAAERILDGDSHPPSWVRFSIINDFLVKWGQSSSSSETIDAAVRQFFEIFYLKCLPIWFALHKEDVRPYRRFY